MDWLSLLYMPGSSLYSCLELRWDFGETRLLILIIFLTIPELGVTSSWRARSRWPTLALSPRAGALCMNPSLLLKCRLPSCAYCCDRAAYSAWARILCWFSLLYLLMEKTFTFIVMAPGASFLYNSAGRCGDVSMMERIFMFSS